MTDASPTAESPQLGPYHIETLIGEGAYARVYRAVDERLNRTVALKILKPTLLGDPDAVRRFLREAQVAAGLFHQRLATVLDAGEAGGYYYLAMRYVEGPNLAQVLAERGPLPWDEVVRLTQQIAEALSVLHAQGIVHRDLKPQNILLEHGREVVLTDFGLVHALHSSGLSTHSTALVGTPAYIPPESWEGQKATPQADQYALACVVYEMATGKVLYDGPSTPAIMRKHFGEPPMPERWPAGVPAGLGDVLRKALAQDPEARYEDIRAFAAALAGLGAAAVEEKPVQEEPTAEVQAKPAPPSPETNRAPAQGATPPRVSSTPSASETFSRRATAEVKHRPRSKPRKGLLSLVGLVLLLAVVGGVSWINHTYNRITVDNVKQIVQLARWDKGAINQVAFSPNEKLLAVASSASIYLYDTEKLKAVRFIEPEAKVLSVAFSPDGTLLASGLDDGSLRLWQVSDGVLLRTLKGHTDRVFSVAFSPDGTLLASGSGDNTVRLWQVSDGTLVHTLLGHANRVRSVIFSPDGALLASAADDHTVRLWQVSDGTLMRALKGDMGRVQSVAFSPDGTLLALGSDDNNVLLWRVLDGAPLRTLKGHTGRVLSVAFSPDGKMLASGAGDNTVRLWRVSNGILLRTLEGRAGWVESVAFSPDGRLLASGSYGGTVRLWGVQP